LTRQSARELCGFGVADMNLIPHGCFPWAKKLPGTSVPPRRRRRNRTSGRDENNCLRPDPLLRPVEVRDVEFLGPAPIG
jgi:hypothetical protein